jgi:tetratricopeptide (TPR) repeat protein
MFTPQTTELLSVLASSSQRHFFVPFGRNKDFVGRESALAQLLERIPPNADKDDCQWTAIEGLGGVGKTQIALEAAFRVRNEHPDCSVFWVPTVDVTSFENAYRDVGRRLGVAGIDEDNADVKALVKAALSREDAGSWLLIIDNADDVELLFGPSPLCDRDCLPFSHRGSILFTTRNHEIVRKLDIPKTGVIHMADMSRLEATELLQKHLDESQTSDPDSTTELLDFLANLPLAIKQASAYMDQTGITTKQYLGHCRSSDESLVKLLSKDFEDRARYKNTRNPVAATWLVSFDHISRYNQLAAQYLNFMSFLAEKEIPKSLLPPGKSALEANEAIGTLKAYAFITERAGQESYDTHRLVRLAMRVWLAEEGDVDACATTLIRHLDAAFPDPTHENRAVWVVYLPHTSSALGFGAHSADHVAESSLLAKVAKSTFLIGRYQDAEGLSHQALKLRAQVLGAEHPDTLTSISNLANSTYMLGKYQDAEELGRQALKLRTKVLGIEHPDTLVSMNNVANMLHKQEKYKGEEEAEAIHRQTLKLRTQVLGAEHPDTLLSMTNLANVLRRQGNYKEAEPMYRQTLKLRTRVLGVEHPHTVLGMHQLAGIFRRQGKYKEAEAMYRQGLELRTRVLGVDHPDTISCKRRLASILHR